MEEEMLQKINEIMDLANKAFEEGNYQIAFFHYLGVLFRISAYLLYRDLGMLIPPEGTLGMMKVRYPDIYDVIEKYKNYQLALESVTEEIAKNIREDALRIYDKEIP